MASSKQEQDIVIRIIKKFNDVNTSSLKIKKIAKALCHRFGRHEPIGTRYEISIAIVDDNEIRKLNKEFLNSKAATDCLSFDLSEDDKGQKIFDLVVNGEMAVR